MTHLHPTTAPRIRPWRDAALATASVLLVALVGLGLSYRAAHRAQIEAVRNERQQLAATLAAQIDGDLHRTIRSKAQAGSPEHLRALAPIGRFLRSARDIIYAYTAVLQNGEIHPQRLLRVSHRRRRAAARSDRPALRRAGPRVSSGARGAARDGQCGDHPGEQAPELPNGQPVKVSGLDALQFTNGTTSQGDTLPAQENQAVLEENGVDVTDEIVHGPCAGSYLAAAARRPGGLV